MKIGIFGGSFDPVHNEHINTAVYGIKDLQLDLLFIVPAFIPPHKQNAVLQDTTHRFNMLKLAFLNVEASCAKKIKISDFEFNNQQKSYTYITVEHFKKTFPDSQLYLFMGTDMLENFPSWKNPQQILKNCTLFVTKRTGEDFSKAYKTFKDSFNGDNQVVVSSYVGKNLSSSKIKNSLLLGLNVSDMLPTNVEKYIYDNNLYEGDDVARFVQKSLPIKRLNHVCGVMTLAKKYARILNVDENKAVLSAMLHDIAKYEDYTKYKDFKLDDDVPKNVVHQFLGAYIAENILGIKDKDILNAIRYHTTGRPNMCDLEKIVFVADLLEEGRSYTEVDYLRQKVDEDFYQGFALCVQRLMHFLNLQNENIYWLTKSCCDFYCNKTNLQ